MTDRPQTTTPNLAKLAALAVLGAPFCGPSPMSNRWGDLDYKEPPMTGPILFPGEAVALAVQNGWLLAVRLREPGFVLTDDPAEGGEFECWWRYHAVPAWRTILLGRQLRGDYDA